MRLADARFTTMMLALGLIVCVVNGSPSLNVFPTVK